MFKIFLQFFKSKRPQSEPNRGVIMTAAFKHALAAISKHIFVTVTEYKNNINTILITYEYTLIV